MADTTALQEMLATKRKFGKVDKRQGCHFIISFKKQEVRPETAMEITQKFVEKFFGDDFQCLYATHDNTQQVLSHILFNSVSWRTGKKYRYEKGDWAREIQPIVNELCKEYGLSIQDIEAGTEEKRFIRLTDISGYYTKEVIENQIEKGIQKETRRSGNCTPRIVGCRKNYRKYIPQTPYEKAFRAKMYRTGQLKERDGVRTGIPTAGFLFHEFSPKDKGK